MKKVCFKVVVILLLLILPTTLAIPTKRESPPEETTVEIREKTDWDYFIEALIWEESKGLTNVIGTHNDVGILQITPIYVKEVNRLLKKEIYTLECRFDSIKSLEMFDVIQSHYNPSKSIDKAIKLHNPKASENYGIRIKKKMNQLVNNI